MHETTFKCLETVELDKLVIALSRNTYPSALKDSDGDDRHVVFDFCRVSPVSLISYRGDYSQLALTWSENGEMLVKDLIQMLKSAVGKDFEGYKGGMYTCDVDTPIWVDNYRRASETAIVGMAVPEFGPVVLRTLYDG